MIAAGPDADPSPPRASGRYPRKMEPIVWENETPQLRNPVLVATFSGWNDAASAASTALGAVAESLETELVAQIDPEEFFDFQAARPQIELTGGKLRGVAWPENLVVAGRSPEAERDVLLISGTEPSTRWRTFCNCVLDIAERCGVESMVTFGSLIADVAHTRPVPITGLATTTELIERLGFDDVAYEGPTGILGVLHGIARDRGITRPASGPPSPTTPPPSRTRRRRWRCCAGSRACPGSRSTPPSSRRPRRPSRSRSARRSPPIPRSRSWSSGSSEQQDDLAGLSPRTFPVATRSPGTSRASWRQAE